MTYSLPAESGSPTLVMLTSTGGKIISSSRLLLSGAEMLLLLDLQVSLTPGTVADTESQVEQLYQTGQEAKTGHKNLLEYNLKLDTFPCAKINNSAQLDLILMCPVLYNITRDWF